MSNQYLLTATPSSLQSIIVVALQNPTLILELRLQDTAMVESLTQNHGSVLEQLQSLDRLRLMYGSWEDNASWLSGAWYEPAIPKGGGMELG